MSLSSIPAAQQAKLRNINSKFSDDDDDDNKDVINDDDDNKDDNDYDKDDNHKQFEPVEGWRWSIGSWLEFWMELSTEIEWMDI